MSWTRAPPALITSPHINVTQPPGPREELSPAPVDFWGDWGGQRALSPSRGNRQPSQAHPLPEESPGSSRVGSKRLLSLRGGRPKGRALRKDFRQLVYGGAKPFRKLPAARERGRSPWFRLPGATGRAWTYEFRLPVAFSRGRRLPSWLQQASERARTREFRLPVAFSRGEEPSILAAGSLGKGSGP